MESHQIWGEITTEGITFEVFCEALMSIRAARECATLAELGDLLGDVVVVSRDTREAMIKSSFKGWGDDTAERFEDAFTALSGTREGVHVHAKHSTRGEYPRVHVHVPDVTRDEAAFGELRSVLAREPSAETFARLCEVIGEAQVDPQLLEYARARLARWPEHVERRAPTSWIWRHAHWETCPQLMSCNRIEVPISPGNESHRYGESQRHESVLVPGLAMREPFRHFFEYERLSIESESRFMRELSGLVFRLDGRDVIITNTDPNNYNMKYRTGRMMERLPDRFFHVYACNAWGDHVRMKLYEGPALVYQEELRSPLPHEATLFDVSGEVAFLVEDRPSDHAAALIGALRARMLAAGVDPKTTLARSRVAGWFGDDALDLGGTSAEASERESLIGHRIEREWARREMPASRAALEETLLDDNLPF